jgi:hypothetical protein
MQGHHLVIPGCCCSSSFAPARPPPTPPLPPAPYPLPPSPLPPPPHPCLPTRCVAMPPLRPRLLQSVAGAGGGGYRDVCRALPTGQILPWGRQLLQPVSRWVSGCHQRRKSSARSPTPIPLSPFPSFPFPSPASLPPFPPPLSPIPYPLSPFPFSPPPPVPSGLEGMQERLPAAVPPPPPWPPLTLALAPWCTTPPQVHV